MRLCFFKLPLDRHCVKWYTFDIKKETKGGAEVSSNRVTIIINDEMKSAINELKRKRYYDKSYAEMYRDLLDIALDAVEPHV